MSLLIDTVFLITSACLLWASPIVLMASTEVVRYSVISCIPLNTLSKYPLCSSSFCEFSSTCKVISFTFFCTLAITASTSSKDDCVLFARFPTSCATTAKPLPASPALAASMDAFNASRFVDSEISLIRFKVTPISFTASDSFCATSMVESMELVTSLLIVCKLLSSFSFSFDLSNKFLEVASTLSTLSATTSFHLFSSLRFDMLSSVFELRRFRPSNNCSLVAESSSAEALSFSDIWDKVVPAADNCSERVLTETSTFCTCSLLRSISSFFAFTRNRLTKNVSSTVVGKDRAVQIARSRKFTIKYSF